MSAPMHAMLQSQHYQSLAAAPIGTGPQPARDRNGPLDWVKGALVVLMVVYHSLNYSLYSHLAFAYIGFLPVSFIFIAGFLLTNSYLVRYDLRDWRLHRRLVVRGAKLILIFTALNLTLYFIAYGVGFLRLFLDNWEAIYFATGGRVASYPILTSIGYLLLLAPLLLSIGSLNRLLLRVVAVSLLIVCSFMEWRASVGYHLGMISAGVIGTAFGFIPLQRITVCARKSMVVVALYLMYRTARYFVGEPYPLQMLGVLTTLLLLYSVGLKLPVKSHMFTQVVLMGRYSLLGYIMQLGIIQVTVKVAGPVTTPLAVVALMLFALAATWFVTAIVQRLRAKARFVDVTYRFAFA